MILVVLILTAQANWLTDAFWGTPHPQEHRQCTRETCLVGHAHEAKKVEEQSQDQAPPAPTPAPKAD